MDHGDEAGKRLDPATAANELEQGRVAGAGIVPGMLLDLYGTKRCRIVAIIHGRVLMTDLKTDAIFLTEDADGSIQLPRLAAILAMTEEGTARRIVADPHPASDFDRMLAQVEMLEAAQVRQGDKAIAIHLATHWSPAFEARFGPHDHPSSVRRWRAAYRAEAARGKSAHTSSISEADVIGGAKDR